MAEHNKTRQISPSKRRGTGGVTLADVATLAGVSTITASRALSNPTLVNPATRARVHEAVHKSGYIPNYLAGGLKSKRSRLIACLVPTIASGSAFLVAVHAMSEAFGGAGYQVLLGERGYDVSREETLVESVIARRPDGIVLTGVMQSEAARRRLSTTGIPVVETWDMTDSPIDLLVGFSHEDVGRAIAHYLYRRGRRRLGVISSTEPRGAARARGFAEAVVALGLAPSVTDVPTHTIGAPTQLIHGRAGVASLLAAHPTLDAISCATDLVALGALIEARVRGICVPDDLAIVGFGLSTELWVAATFLMLSGCCDSVSVVIRGSIMQLTTPDHMRGRVSAINGIFIGSSNELGALESGIAASLMGLVPSIIFGGIATIAVVTCTYYLAPQLRRLHIADLS